MSSLGHRVAKLNPIKQATNREILWAAGFYEGDGSCYKGSTERACISQVNKEPLEFMQHYFGGAIYPHYRGNIKAGAWQWSISGARARGFLQTIYELVSPTVQIRIAKVMGWI